MARILASDVFSRSERMKRFLRFAVEQALAGEEETIKEYTIAVEVFDKPPAFDPRVDPIVRVEAGRLRSKLREYYDTEGREDPILIGFPKRGYAPQFEPRRRGPIGTGEKPPIYGDMSSAQFLVEHPLPPRAFELNSVAVLPFIDLSPKKDQEYFCDGITEEIVNTLSRVEGLNVVARTSVMQYKDQARDVRNIGIELNANTVLEGSVRKSGRRVRISAQLINVADGYNLWSDVYDREMRDIFEVQQEISHAIVKALRIRLKEEGALMVKPGTRSPAAYQLYLQGRYHWAKPSLESLRRAVKYFEKAVAKEPSYALAYAGMADAYAALAWLGLLSPKAGWEKAAQAARTAVELDPTLSQAYTSMGCVEAAYEWHWGSADRTFRRAIDLNPAYPPAHQNYAIFCLAPRGQLGEAVRAIGTAQELDPTSPVIYAHLGWLECLRGRNDEARTHFQKSLELDPAFYLARFYLGCLLEVEDRLDDALAAFQTAERLGGAQPLLTGGVARCQALMGDTKAALGSLKRLKAKARRSYAPPVDIANVYAGLGQADTALEWLERGLEERCSRMIHIAVEPAYKEFRPHPRFTALVRKLFP